MAQKYVIVPRLPYTYLLFKLYEWADSDMEFELLISHYFVPRQFQTGRNDLARFPSMVDSLRDCFPLAAVCTQGAETMRAVVETYHAENPIEQMSDIVLTKSFYWTQINGREYFFY